MEAAMFPKRVFDPAEFEISTRRSGCEFRVTFDLDKEDRDFLEMVAKSESFAYRSIDDVLRHSVARHVKFLAKTTGFSLRSLHVVNAFRILREARQQLEERDFCVVLDIFHDLIIHFLCRNRQLARLLAESLRCRVRGMRSGLWKEIYLQEIDEILNMIGGDCPSFLFPKVSLKPSTFRNEAENGRD
jgi:hypothetical protein